MADAFASSLSNTVPEQADVDERAADPELEARTVDAILRVTE
jgi:hypothetical protein